MGLTPATLWRVIRQDFHLFRLAQGALWQACDQPLNGIALLVDLLIWYTLVKPDVTGSIPGVSTYLGLFG